MMSIPAKHISRTSMKAHVAAAKDGVGGHAAGQLPPRGSASVFKTRLNSGRPVGRAGAVDLSPSPSLRTAVAHGPHRICKGCYEQQVLGVPGVILMPSMIDLVSALRAYLAKSKLICTPYSRRKSTYTSQL